MERKGYTEVHSDVHSNKWKPFTPTFTGSWAKKRTFWQWLLRKPRPQVILPVAMYKQKNKIISFKVFFKEKR